MYNLVFNKAQRSKEDAIVFKIVMSSETFHYLKIKFHCGKFRFLDKPHSRIWVS